MPVPSNDLTQPADPSARQSLGRSEERVQGVLPVRPNHEYFYVHYGRKSGNWFVGDIEAGPGVPEDEVGSWWLPVLQREPCQPGINGHRTRKDGQDPSAAYDDAHSRIKRDHGTILSRDLGYMTERDCALGTAAGKYHSDVWTTPVVVEDDRIKFKFDRQRFHRWLLSLMRDGHIDPPADHIVNTVTAKVADRIGRREQMCADLPPARYEAHIAEAQAEADRVANAQVIEPAAPAPRSTKVRVRKPKAEKP